MFVVTARKRSLGQGNMFTGVCLSTGGVPGWGVGVWVPGPRGVSGPGGGAWSGGPGLGGHLVRGGGLVETPPDGYCWGRYASYWNAFLFTNPIKISFFVFVLKQIL